MILTIMAIVKYKKKKNQPNFQFKVIVFKKY